MSARSSKGIWATRAVVAVVFVALWTAQTTVMTGAVSLGLLWAIMVLGVYITYRILDIADLTVEGTITLGASIAARMITAGISPVLATLAALALGLLAGLATGLLHTKLRIPALLAGILTMTGLYSVNLLIMDRPNIPLLPFKVDSVFTPLQQLGLPNDLSALAVGLAVVLVVAAILYWFFGTELGCAVRATGNNPNMVRAQGVNTSTMIILGLMVSNGLVGLAGALIAQYQTFSDISMGIGSIVIGLASLIIGEVLFGTRSFKNTLVAVILGAVIYRVIIAEVIGLGLPANNLRLFVALTVTIALALPIFRDYGKTVMRSLKRPDDGRSGKAG
ncbi:MAG: ABC transporter permease [Coriobacteriales bacterium]|jgi:putative ABC transport system permease protein|nr:ABC transporter permease [Coriobacteriales bacterium]